MKTLNTYILEKFRISGKPVPLDYEKGTPLLILEYTSNDDEDYGSVYVRLARFEKSTHVEIWYNDSLKGDLKSEGFLNDKGYYESIKKEETQLLTRKEIKISKLVFLPIKVALEVLEVLKQMTEKEKYGIEGEFLKRYFDTSDKDVNKRYLLVTGNSEIKKIIEKIEELEN